MGQSLTRLNIIGCFSQTSKSKFCRSADSPRILLSEGFGVFFELKHIFGMLQLRPSLLPFFRQKYVFGQKKCFCEEDTAYLSSCLLLLITFGAMVGSYFFERRIWCRHLCPIGGMNGLYVPGKVIKSFLNLFLFFSWFCLSFFVLLFWALLKGLLGIIFIFIQLLKQILV